MERGAPFDQARDAAVPRLPERDRRLAHELAAGVLRRRTELDEVLKPHLPRGLGGVDPGIHAVLRLGAYQLRMLDRIPAHAAVGTSVDLARAAGGDRAARFVNALLRRVAADRGPSPPAKPAARTVSPRTLARRYSHPEWLVRRWVARFGAEETEALMAWNNRRPPLVVQPARLSLMDLMQSWRKAGIEIREAPFGAGLLAPRQPLRTLPGFAEGAFVVQDPAQAMVTRFAAPGRGAWILDACAAPGGKAIGLGREARLVLAAELDGRRLSRLVENLARAGSGREHPVRADAVAPPVRAADLVLLDAPCLATGTFARHPDARWRVRPAALEALARRQALLLRGLADAVRPGGLLVYSTCSLEPEENEMQIERFLVGRPEFRREPVSTLPAGVLSTEGDLALVPQRHGTDGAYAARLRRAA